MLLSNPNSKLEVRLSGAIATKQIPVTVHFDNTSISAKTPIATITPTNGVFSVVIVDTPAVGMQRELRFLSAPNIDTAPVEITLQINVAGVITPLITVMLSIGDTFLFRDGEFYIIDATGAKKGIGSSGANGLSAYQIAVLHGFVGSEADWLLSLQGGVTAYTRIAGEVLSASMVVMLAADDKVYKFNIANNAHYGKAIGVTKTSAGVGATVELVAFPNEHMDVGSGWAAGTSYFISATSLLTSTPPSSGICKNVALGVDTDKIKLKDGVETILL